MKDPGGPGEYGVVRAVGSLIGLCLGMVAAAAPAARADCAPVIRADALRGPWASAVAALRRALAERDDVDRCVELILRPDARGVRVTARLAGGGDATRLIESPDDLGPTILALLLIPPAPPPAPPPPLPAVAAPAAPVALPPVEPAPAPEPPAVERLERVIPAPISAATSRFEIGMAASARWQQRLEIGAGGFADISLGPWLVGANGRWGKEAGDQVTPAERLAGAGGTRVSYTARSLELGVELGRRFAVGPVELSALLGPRLAAIAPHYEPLPVPITVINQATGEISTLQFAAPSSRITRVAASLRARWAGSARLKMTFGIDASFDVDAERGDGRLVANSDMVVLIGLPPRSAWGVALTLGGLFRVWP